MKYLLSILYIDQEHKLFHLKPLQHPWNRQVAVSCNKGEVPIVILVMLYDNDNWQELHLFTLLIIATEAYNS